MCTAASLINIWVSVCSTTDEIGLWELFAFQGVRADNRVTAKLTVFTLYHKL